MRIIKKKSSFSREKEDSVFARSKTTIFCKLEEDKPKECLESADDLPLLESSKDPESTKSPLKIKPMKKKYYCVMTDANQEDMTNSSFSSGKKNRLKIRGMFSGSSNKKKKKSHARQPSDLDTIPILSFSSRDTDSQTDDGERISFSDVVHDLVDTVNSSDECKIDFFTQKSVVTVVGNHEDQIDATMENVHSDQPEMSARKSNKDAVNVLNELVCMETNRLGDERPALEHSDMSKSETDYHALVSSEVSKRMKEQTNNAEKDICQEKDEELSLLLEDDRPDPEDRKLNAFAVLDDALGGGRNNSQKNMHNEPAIGPIGSKSSNDDVSVATVKCSNCSEKEKSIQPTRYSSFPSSNPTPKTSNARPKDKRRQLQRVLRVSFDNFRNFLNIL